MNCYRKYCPNVFVLESPEEYQRGDTADIETKYGKVHEVIVFNKLFTRNGLNYYSQVRSDGFNAQESARMKARRYSEWSDSAASKSDEYYRKSNRHSDFLSLGEPIKIGHHSERRHRHMIDDANRNMGKCIELSNKADEHAQRAAYWESRANDINLSMPESIDYYSHKLEEAKRQHLFYKENPDKREHSYSLTYAKKAVNEAKKNYDTAVKLWGDGGINE